MTKRLTTQQHLIIAVLSSRAALASAEPVRALYRKAIDGVTQHGAPTRVDATTYAVRSRTDRSARYTVTYDGAVWRCDCPARFLCHHIRQVEAAAKVDADALPFVPEPENDLLAAVVSDDPSDWY